MTPSIVSTGHKFKGWTLAAKGPEKGKSSQGKTKNRNDRKPLRLSSGYSGSQNGQKNTVGGSSRQERRHRLNVSLDGDFYGCVDGQFDLWFPPFSNGDLSWSKFKTYIRRKKCSGVKNKTFFRSGKEDLGLKEHVYVEYLVESINLVAYFMINQGEDMVNRLYGLDTQNESKAGDIAEARPDVTILAINKEDVTVKKGTTPREQEKQIKEFAKRIAKLWCNGACFFEVKVTSDYNGNHTKQALDYGYIISRYLGTNVFINS